MNYDKLLSLADKMASKAKPGKLKHRGIMYTLTPIRGGYEYRCTDDNGFDEIFNCKSAAVAKKYLKEYLEN